MKLNYRGKIFLSLLGFAGKELKQRFFVVSALKIVSSFIDLLGIAFLFSIISILVQTNESNKYLDLANEYVPQLVSSEYFDFQLLLVAFLLFLLKNIFGYYVDIIGINLSQQTSSSLTKAMINSFYKKGYLYLQHNKVFNLSHKSNGLAFEFGSRVIPNAWQLIQETCLFLLFILIAFKLSPYITLVLFIFSFTIGFTVLKQTRKKAIAFSISQNKKQPDVEHVMNTLFKGLTEMKIYGTVDLFLKKYLNKVYEANQIRFGQLKLKVLPKRILELSTIVLIMGLYFVHTITETTDGGNILLDFGIFAIFGYKIVPGISRLVDAGVSFGNTQNGRNLLFKNLSEKDQDASISPSEIQFKQLISLKNINFKFNNSIIFKNLNLDINKGSIIGIVGESGAGKSTLSKIIMGLHQPDSGSFIVDGKEYANINSEKWLRQFGFIGPETLMLDESVYENVSFSGDANQNIKLIEDSLRQCNLDEFIGANREMGEDGKFLSTGQKQRIALARALYHKPKILVLDEFSSNLDAETESGLLALISHINKTQQLTVLLISHKKSALKIVNKIYKLEDCKLNLLESIE